MSRVENGNKPRVLVFASGDKDGGGSGFREMVEYARTTPAVLNAEIVAVVSNHLNGGVRKIAKEFKIPFRHFQDKFDEKAYQDVVWRYSSDFVMLSGWLKLVKGLDPATTINIHPGPLPAYGGSGMYGHFVHEAVIEDFKAGKITQSAVTMHFVDEEYD